MLRTEKKQESLFESEMITPLKKEKCNYFTT